MQKISQLTVDGLTALVVRQTNFRGLVAACNLPYAELVVRASWDMPEEELARLLRARAAKIEERRRLLAPWLALRLWGPEEERYLYFWGRKYHLQVESSYRKRGMRLEGERIIVLAPPHKRQDQQREIVEKYLRQELERAVKAVLAERQAALGVEIAALQIKKMRSRWGSCTPLKKRLSLNLALVHFDLEALAYILTHELVHLWELNHSPSFYARLDRYYPNWRELKRYLGCPIQKALPLYGERQLPDSLYAALGIAPGASSRPAGSSSEAQRLLA